MAQDLKTIEDASDRELPQKIVGAVEHHIRVMQVAPHRVCHTSKSMPKISHGEGRGSAALSET